MRFITLLLLGIPTHCFAQFVNVPMTIRTPQGNVHTSYQIYQPNNRYYGNTTRSSSYALKIVTKTDSTYSCMAWFDFSEKKHFIHVNGKRKERLFPSDTKDIVLIPAEYDYITTPIVGIPADTCWLFMTVKGKINGYSYLPELGTSYLVAVQRGDGSIMSLTKQNLIALIESPDERTSRLISKGRLAEAVIRYNKDR